MNGTAFSILGAFLVGDLGNPNLQLVSEVRVVLGTSKQPVSTLHNSAEQGYGSLRNSVQLKSHECKGSAMKNKQKWVET